MAPDWTYVAFVVRASPAPSAWWSPTAPRRAGGASVDPVASRLRHVGATAGSRL